MTRMEKNNFYDRISILLTDYEGNGNDIPVTIEDMYDLLVDIQCKWEELTGETEQ